MSYKKKISIVSTGREIYISSLRSSAGKLGSSRRWANHKKVKTRLIRITEDDYTILRSLACNRGSISAAVSFALSNCRRCRLSCIKPPDRGDPGI